MYIGSFHFHISILQSDICNCIKMFHVAFISIFTVLVMIIIFKVHIHHDLRKAIFFRMEFKKASPDPVDPSIVNITIQVFNISEKSGAFF